MAKKRVCSCKGRCGCAGGAAAGIDVKNSRWFIEFTTPREAHMHAMKRFMISVESHGPELWMRIRDTGPGIPTASRVDVFRPFYTTKNKGTGLGLSISKQIVERHGGSLHLEETPGGGATFVIALPLACSGDMTT